MDLTYKQFINKLKMLHSDIRCQIPNINYGGCGIFAITMYNILKINNNVEKLKIITYHDIDVNYTSHITMLKNRQNNIDACDHHALEVKFQKARRTILFDGEFYATNHTTLTNRLKLNMKHLNISYDYDYNSLKHVVDTGNWNSKFFNAENNFKVEYIIKKNFNY